MRNQQSKRRLIMLLKLLYAKTDEDHLLSTAEIVDYFRSKDIVTDRRTVKADMDLLIDMGHDIVVVKSTQNKFFIGNRLFEVPEVKLLIDAVYASKSITKSKSENLIEKLSSLLSEDQANKLRKNLVISEQIKTVNEVVYYTVDIINRATADNKQISFKYYEYTPAKMKILKHSGYLYCFSPYALLWNEDHYYAIGYSEKHEKVTSFRVDRMCEVSVCDTGAISPSVPFNITSYSNEVFDMFPGREAVVTLKCENDLMKVIIDRFGEDVETKSIDDKRFHVKTTVSVSPTFFGRVFQFAGRVEIISPNEIVEEYQTMLRKANPCG